MASDTDTIRSIMTLAGGALGFTGAIIVFVNSRLQAATTSDAKYELHTNLLTAFEVSLWFGGFLAAVAFGSFRVGLWFILFAYIVHCVLFLRGRSSFDRAEILALVVLTAGLVTMFLMSMLFRVLDNLGRLVDALNHALTHP